jgi:hypothetical protein
MASAPEANYTAIVRAVGVSHSSSHHTRQEANDNANDISNILNNINATTDTPNQPSYLTLSFAPLAVALRFEIGPPADVIMRGWAQVLRPGVGGGADKRHSSPSEEDQHEANGDHREAPGDATSVTVHAASEHVFDYR